MASDPKPRRMLVICPFPRGVAAGQRLKFEQYYADWQAHGWTIDVAPFMDMKLWNILYRPGHIAGKVIGVLRGYLRRLRDLARIGRYDLVYCHMNVSPIGTSLLERGVRKLAPRLVYDIEDNVLVETGPVAKDHPNPILRLIRGVGKARYLVRTADHVITSSPALNDRCRALNHRHTCTYITSSVDTDRFLPANQYQNDHELVIGWTGTFSSRPYLDLLRRVFQELARRRRFRLRVIGNFEYDLPGVHLEVLRWSAEEEVEQLQGVDIGVYPLPADEWVSGKSGLKAIQYLAFGIPCVATNVGTTPSIVRHGENGLLAISEDEWLSALEMLLDDPALRRRLGRQARRDAVRQFSLQAVAGAYRGVLEEVMARP